MTVFRRKRTVVVGRKKIARRDRIYSYDFEINGQRYRGSTGLSDQDDAEEWEANEKKRIRRAARGVGQDDPRESLYIHEWATEYYDVKCRRAGHARPDILHQLKTVLKFFGAKPAERERFDAKAPYHDLRLGDVVEDPYWVERFEQWMLTLGAAPQTRNHWRTRAKDLFGVAAEITFRKRTGVTLNPFVGLVRERTASRKATLTPAELAAWLEQASYHTRLAISIGALAPKLRRGSILALDFLAHIQCASPAFPRPRAIVVHEHKTADATGEPQVYPITRQLARILLDARRRNLKANPKSTRVVLYRGRPVKDIEESARSAALAAGLKWGRFGGITFHSLRHTASSAFAAMNTNAFKHLDLMGWKDLRTPLGYTHLQAEQLRPEAEQLSERFPIAQAAMLPHSRAKARRPMVGTLATSRSGNTRKQAGKDETRDRAISGAKRGIGR